MRLLRQGKDDDNQELPTDIILQEFSKFDAEQKITLKVHYTHLESAACICYCIFLRGLQKNWCSKVYCKLCETNFHWMCEKAEKQSHTFRWHSENSFFKPKNKWYINIEGSGYISSLPISIVKKGLGLWGCFGIGPKCSLVARTGNEHLRYKFVVTSGLLIYTNKKIDWIVLKLFKNAGLAEGQ